MCRCTDCSFNTLYILGKICVWLFFFKPYTWSQDVLIGSKNTHKFNNQIFCCCACSLNEAQWQHSLMKSKLHHGARNFIRSTSRSPTCLQWVINRPNVGKHAITVEPLIMLKRIKREKCYKRRTKRRRKAQLQREIKKNVTAEKHVCAKLTQVSRRMF